MPKHQPVNSLRTLALSICSALARLQVDQQHLDKDPTNSWLMQHPFWGPLIIPADEFIDAPCVIRSSGVGIQFNGNGTPIVLDYGGIWDSLTGEVVGDHYSTSHFAWLTSLLKEEADWRNGVAAAFAFHEKTYQRYPFSEQEPHWEFNNLAWMEIWFQVKDDMPDLSERLKVVLLSAPWHPRPYGTNWKLMLAHFLLLRYKAFGRYLDNIIGHFYLRWALSMQDRDGCLLDVPRHGSRSLQYHAYSAALLFRMCDMGVVGKNVENRAIRAANWLLAHSAPDGDCVWRGRGQGQIFGYAASSYVFRSAIQRKPPNVFLFSLAHERLQGFILKNLRPDGLLPLVINNYSDETHIGWYDYNHLTVYNAFAGVWFALPPHISDGEDWALQPEETKVIHFRDSQILIVKTEKLFFSTSVGELAYPAESGMTIQMLWIKGIGTLIRGAAGPGYGAYGNRYSLSQEQYNYAIPLAISGDESLIGPGGTRHRMRSNDTAAMLEGEYGGIHLERRIDWSGEEGTLITITDTVTVIAKEKTIILPINLPLQNWGISTVSVGFSQVKIYAADVSLVLDFRIDSCPVQIVVDDVEPQPLGPSLRITSPRLALNVGESCVVTQQWRLVR